MLDFEQRHFPGSCESKPNVMPLRVLNRGSQIEKYSSPFCLPRSKANNTARRPSPCWFSTPNLRNRRISYPDLGPSVFAANHRGSVIFEEPPFGQRSFGSLCLDSNTKIRTPSFKFAPSGLNTRSPGKNHRIEPIEYESTRGPIQGSL